jgi:hypothetical protein
MRNPFRSEAEAFNFLLVSVGVAAAIVLAGLVGGTWYGVGVAIVTIGAVTWWYWKSGERPRPVPAAPTKQDEVAANRILVIANETIGGRALRERIRHATQGGAEVFLVSPALNSRLKHWASDEDEARLAAQERLDASLARLRSDGIEARGQIGDSEPLQAVEDALRTFGANEIIISTHPRGRSNWLEQGLVEQARERFAVPITHVVVDLQAEQPEQEA